MSGKRKKVSRPPATKPDSPERTSRPPRPRLQTPKALKRRYKECAVDALMVPEVVKNLSDYFRILGARTSLKNQTCWFRGHGSVEYDLVPGALRFPKVEDRNRALGLLQEFRRVIDIRLPRPPKVEEQLEWMQIAQHHGLPTRLLDWTDNAAAALFFACLREDQDGLVVILDPLELNEHILDPSELEMFRQRSRVLDPQDPKDRRLINPYMKLRGSFDLAGGKPTIAINPVLNSERILLQSGKFTLHGSKHRAIDRNQVPSLQYIPILAEYKELLQTQLKNVGVTEMSLFPEPEHVCRHLRRSAGLMKKEK